MQQRGQFQHSNIPTCWIFYETFGLALTFCAVAHKFLLVKTLSITKHFLGKAKHIIQIKIPLTL